MTYAYLTIGFMAVGYVVWTFSRAVREARQRQMIVRRLLEYGDLYVTLLEIERLPETREHEKVA